MFSNLYSSTVLPTFTLLAIPAVPFLTCTLPEGRQVGTVGSCFVAVMGVFFTFIDIYKHNRVKATSQEALLYSGYDTHVKQFTGWSQYCIKMITYAGEAVPSEPFVTFTDKAPVHVTTD